MLSFTAKVTEELEKRFEEFTVITLDLYNKASGVFSITDPRTWVMLVTVGYAEGSKKHSSAIGITHQLRQGTLDEILDTIGKIILEGIS